MTTTNKNSPNQIPQSGRHPKYPFITKINRIQPLVDLRNSRFINRVNSVSAQKLIPHVLTHRSLETIRNRFGWKRLEGGRNNVYPKVSGEKELERRKERDWKEAVNLGCRYRPARRAILLVKMLIRRGKRGRKGGSEARSRGFIDFARLFAEDRRKLYS